MTVDDLLKLIFVLAIAFAIVIIAIGIFKILNSLSGTVEDFRRAVKNTSTLSDYILEDYQKGRSVVYKVLEGLSSIKKQTFDPLKILLKIVHFFRKFTRGEEDEIEE